MDTVISQLDQKYEQYKDRLYGDQFVDSDTLVFDSAYEYFCITETQAKVKEILDKDRLDFEKKKQEIITYNTSVETQKEFIENAEFNSLSFCYYEILKAVYMPMSKQKHALNPLSEKDITGDIILFRERFVNVMNFFVLKIVKLFRIPIKKDVDARVALYKMTYNFKRKKYPLYMENVHKLLVQKLLEIHTQKSVVVESSKIHIIIDSKKGIYQAGNDKLSYKIDKISKRLKLIKYLAVKDNCRISELEGAMDQTKSSLITAIAGINKMFRKETGLVDDLVIHIDTGGYSLNKEIFDIEILE